MEEMGLDPVVFFRTLRMREVLLTRRKPVACAALARLFRRLPRDVWDDLDHLVTAGLVFFGDGGYVLTDEGRASLRWSCPPPPDGVVRARWAGELARAIADHHGIPLADVLHAEVGQGVVARSRLCFGLYARGWSVERIEEHFGLPVGWAKRGIERWKRMRDELPPRSAAELRAWRARHGLTQKEAARRLGVHRMTVVRAERAPTWSPSMALARE